MKSFTTFRLNIYIKSVMKIYDWFAKYPNSEKICVELLHNHERSFLYIDLVFLELSKRAKQNKSPQLIEYYFRNIFDQPGKINIHRHIFEHYTGDYDKLIILFKNYIERIDSLLELVNEIRFINARSQFSLVSDEMNDIVAQKIFIICDDFTNLSLVIDLIKNNDKLRHALMIELQSRISCRNDAYFLYKASDDPQIKRSAAQQIFNYSNSFDDYVDFCKRTDKISGLWFNAFSIILTKSDCFEKRVIAYGIAEGDSGLQTKVLWLMLDNGNSILEFDFVDNHSEDFSSAKEEAIQKMFRLLVKKHKNECNINYLHYNKSINDQIKEKITSIQENKKSFYIGQL